MHHENDNNQVYDSISWPTGVDPWLDTKGERAATNVAHKVGQLHDLVLELRIGVETVAESNGQANVSVDADEEKSDTWQDPVDTCAGADAVQKAASRCQEWHQEVYPQSVLGLVNSGTLADHTNQQPVGQRTANKHCHKASDHERYTHEAHLGRGEVIRRNGEEARLDGHNDTDDKSREAELEL